MKLTGLLAQYGVVQARLSALMGSSELPSTDLSLLFRQALNLREQIIATPPQTPDEATEKLACIVNLIQRDTETLGLQSELETLLTAAQATCAHLTNTGLSGTRSPDHLAETPSLPNRHGTFGGSVAEYVTFAEGRVSLIDTEYRYTATSTENAQFYGRTPVAMMGVHVAELIGDKRFATRARGRFETCFDGQPQSYHHALPDTSGARIMRCDMKPVCGNDGTVIGSLVYMTDVTDQARRMRPSTDAVMQPPARLSWS